MKKTHTTGASQQELFELVGLVGRPLNSGGISGAIDLEERIARAHEKPCKKSSIIPKSLPPGVLPAPERFSRQYWSNPTIHNLQFYLGIIKPEGLRRKGVSNFVHKDPVHSWAIRHISEQNLDLKCEEGIRAVEDAIKQEFGANALNPIGKNGSAKSRSGKPTGQQPITRLRNLYSNGNGTSKNAE